MREADFLCHWLCNVAATVDIRTMEAAEISRIRLADILFPETNRLNR